MLLRNGTLFINGQLEQGKQLVLADGKIAAVQEQNNAAVASMDLEGRYVLPGLVDLQLNGGGGCFFANSISVESILQIHRTHLKYGTTSFLITLTTSHFDNIFKAIEVVRAYQQQYPGLLGLHVEGPYINPIKKGAHPKAFIRKPDIAEFEQIIKAGQDVIKIMTIAPEVFSAEELEVLAGSDILLSIGHSNASYAEAERGFRAGVKMATHLYNAMSALESRAPGVVGAVMNHPEIWSSIIVDGKHCDYAAVELAYKLKQDKLVLISDAAYKDELGEEFQFGATKVRYVDGFYYTEEGRLAGASISMYEAMLNAHRNAGIPLETSISMASERPATLIKAGEVGSIKAGMDADLLILNADWSIHKILQKGKFIEIENASIPI